MQVRDLALMLAGVIGSTVAVVHGVLTQRYMVTPLGRMAGEVRSVSPSVGRLLPLLLHFSAFTWFVGGLTLIAAANWLGREARLVTCAFVGALYLYGVAGNFWATRGRHPGWMLLAVSVVLIAFSVTHLQAE